MSTFHEAVTRTCMPRHACAASSTDMQRALVYVRTPIAYVFVYAVLAGAAVPAWIAIAWGLAWRATT